MIRNDPKMILNWGLGGAALSSGVSQLRIWGLDPEFWGIFLGFGAFVSDFGGRHPWFWGASLPEFGAFSRSLGRFPSFQGATASSRAAQGVLCPGFFWDFLKSRDSRESRRLPGLAIANPNHGPTKGAFIPNPGFFWEFL